MASSKSTLPSNAFSLTGGCFCKSISYTISVPPLDQRPRQGRAVKFPFGAQSEDPDAASQHWPIISLDHCNSCRHVAGSILQAWLICPTSWGAFSLLRRNSTSSEPGNLEKEAPIKPTTLEALKPSKELQDKTWVRHFSSSDNVNRIFCGKCGTSLTYFGEGDPNPKSWGPHFDVALGTLDDECLAMEGVKPNRESWTGDGIAWVKSLLAEGEKAFGC